MNVSRREQPEPAAGRGDQASAGGKPMSDSAPLASPAAARAAAQAAKETPIKNDMSSRRWEFLIARIASAWRLLTTSRYTRSLEAAIELQRDRIDRLELDNRGLLNSMLERGGFSGIPLHGSEP